jgi:hypothetical protein
MSFFCNDEYGLPETVRYFPTQRLPNGCCPT